MRFRLLSAALVTAAVSVLLASCFALPALMGLIVTSIMMFFSLAHSIVLLVYGGRRARAFAMGCLPLQLAGVLRICFMPYPVWQEPMLDTALQSLSLNTAPEGIGLLLMLSWMCGCVGLFALAWCERHSEEEMRNCGVADFRSR